MSKPLGSSSGDPPLGAVCAGCACLDLFLLDSETLPTRESLAMVGSISYTPGCSTSNTGRALAGTLSFARDDTQ
jgi:hypothetical protein